jgi:hypothetical protein
MDKSFILKTSEHKEKCFVGIEENAGYFTVNVRTANVQDKANCVELSGETLLLTTTVNGDIINYFIYNNECFDYTSRISQKQNNTKNEHTSSTHLTKSELFSEENFEKLKMNLPSTEIVLSNTTSKCCVIS